MSKYLFSNEDAFEKHKFGIDLRVYGAVNEHASLAAVSVKVGHFEEFKNTSWFIYVIQKGSGVFVIDDEQVSAKEGDVVSIPPNKRIYYFGTMEMMLIVTPPWSEDNETLIRDVDPSESPLVNDSNN